MSESELKLYELKSCGFCARVRNALEDLELDYESISVPRSRRQREEVYEVSGQYGVPVLVDPANDIEGMPESRDIIQYLYEEYGSEDDEPPGGMVDRLRSRMG